MRGVRGHAVALLLGALGCERGSSPQAAASSAQTSAPLVESASELEPAAPVAPTRSAPPARESSPAERVRSAPLQNIVREGSGALSAELSGGGRAQLLLATKSAPLAPGALAVHAAVAELVSPETRVPTALRSVSSRELLAAAAEPGTRRWLAENARILADGTIDVTVVLAPSRALREVDISVLVEGQPAHGWEARLQTRAPPPEGERSSLAAYQAVLAVDALVRNQERVQVAWDEGSGRLLALRGNGAFSPGPTAGAVRDGQSRLSRHLFHSRRLRERLSRLERQGLEDALRAPRGGLLITPKQLDELLARRDTLLRIIDRRGAQRGGKDTLVLP